MRLTFNFKSNEAVTALALGLLIPAVTAFAIRRVFRPRHQDQHSISPLPLQEIPSSQVFSTEELTVITRAWDDKDGIIAPEGSKFLRDRHGITRYVLDEYRNENADDGSKGSHGGKGIIVLLNGLGTSLKMFKELASKFHNEGYSVLRYDYYGHGYSKYGHGRGNGGGRKDDPFVPYSPELLTDQLEDLLDYVCDKTKEEVVGIVGHSTGGVAAIACSDRWGTAGAKRKVIPKVCLACPAVYSKKPFIARVADRIPNVLTSLLKTVRPLLFIVGDSYMEAGEIAFGRDPKTNEVIYKEQEEKVTEKNLRLFGRVKGVKKHPFLEPAILGLNCNSLREDLHPGLREKLVNVLQKTGDAKCDVLWVWGNLDVTVPYKENIEEVKSWATDNDNFSVQILDRIGHEMFFENSTLVFENILPFFKD